MSVSGRRARAGLVVAGLVALGMSIGGPAQAAPTTTAAATPIGGYCFDPNTSEPRWASCIYEFVKLITSGSASGSGS